MEQHQNEREREIECVRPNFFSRTFDHSCANFEQTGNLRNDIIYAKQSPNLNKTSQFVSERKFVPPCSTTDNSTYSGSTKDQFTT